MNKIGRKKFFISLTTVAAGFIAYISFPFFRKKASVPAMKNKIEVKINPLAVSREKIGKKNVG
ncbi:MAG: hypothetical protein Kow0098_17630 [Ignavibacteriaceae bacterium]